MGGNYTIGGMRHTRRKRKRDAEDIFNYSRIVLKGLCNIYLSKVHGIERMPE